MLLNSLMKEYPASVFPNMTHIVGFSLGAHAAGYAGRYFENITSLKIERISGKSEVFYLEIIFVNRVTTIYHNSAETGGNNSVK